MKHILRLYSLILSFLFFPLQILHSFDFPKDHSFHKGYKLEWCYFIGNLESTDKLKIGYELSFFKAEIQGKEEIFPVHFAISENSQKKHITVDALHRRIGSLGKYTEKMIRSGDYKIEILSPLEFQIVARPRNSSISLNLSLKISNPNEILLQGPNGISPKSRKYPDVFSNYYSIPRLKTNGYIKNGDKQYEIVNGLSWMDHEWSSPRAQKNEKIGSPNTEWDWVCLNLEDGTDIMAFNFRNSKEEASESFGTIRTKNGDVRYFSNSEEVFLLPTSEVWKSKKTGKSYKLNWNLKIGEYNLILKPNFEDQEFDAIQSTGNSYWEGGITATGKINGRESTGNGYLELK